MRQMHDTRKQNLCIGHHAPRALAGVRMAADQIELVPSNAASPRAIVGRRLVVMVQMITCVGWLEIWFLKNRLLSSSFFMKW